MTAKGVWLSDIKMHRFLRFPFSVFSLVLDFIEKIYRTLKTVFDHRFQTPRSSSKTLLVAYFQLSSRCLKVWSNAPDISSNFYK